MNKVLCELLWKRKNGMGLLGPSSCLFFVGCADHHPRDPHRPSSQVRRVGFKEAQTLVKQLLFPSAHTSTFRSRP